LQQKRRDLREEIRLERNLTVGDPRFLGAAVVLPVKPAQAETEREGAPTDRTREDGPDYIADTGVDADRRREIELVGMRLAMAHEQEQGWQPADVSGENHGFDIRSLRFDDEGALAEARYIEVKARAQSGAIRLSANEWKKARRYGEQFWLYIVTQAGTDSPQLQCIRNPAGQFEMDEDIFATGFIIPEENWQQAL
jgi:hypothetical protein